MTDNLCELVIATAKAVAHLLEEGAPEVDGELRRRLLELLSMVEGEASPETKSP
ncbi:hypothetical protein GXW71_06395 [Roseomonas hellenica]|uniref:Uncharacterized protein n=1 Tax=Plastoroseomonas hellenica TaxID=2687306 RepID=A0ABS5EUN8_9PROT|nr:hypothetical protein [Plastoroseomonas hellenica]MBR0663984.1 hypothetical protein [Plastoroseomonas hellenica]